MVDFSLGKGTVLGILKQAGVVRSQVSPTPEQVDEARRLYEIERLPLIRVGERLGFNAETIRQHLKLRGVVLRRPWE